MLNRYVSIISTIHKQIMLNNLKITVKTGKRCVKLWKLTWDDPKNDEVYQSCFHFQSGAFHSLSFPLLIPKHQTTGYYEGSLRKQICLYLKENSKHLYLLNINTSLCYTVISSFHSFYNRHKWEQHHNHCYCISNKGDIFQGKLKFVKCSCLVNNLNFSD